MLTSRQHTVAGIPDAELARSSSIDGLVVQSETAPGPRREAQKSTAGPGSCGNVVSPTRGVSSDGLSVSNEPSEQDSMVQQAANPQAELQSSVVGSGLSDLELGAAHLLPEIPELPKTLRAKRQTETRGETVPSPGAAFCYEADSSAEITVFEQLTAGRSTNVPLAEEIR